MRPTKHETPTSRLPPYSEDAESAVLGSILVDSEAALRICVDLSMSPEDFYVPANRIIYQALLDLAANDSPVDLLTVPEYLRDKGKLEVAGGLARIEALIDQTPTAANAAYYAAIVMEKSKLRRVIDSSRSAIEEVYSGERSSVEICTRLASDVMEVARESSLDEKPDEQREVYVKDWERARHEPVGVPSLWLPAENMMAGYRPKQSIIIGARPSCGKTIIMGNETEHMADHGTPVGIYSLEMPAEDLRMRMACARAHVSSFRLIRGHATSDEIQRVNAEWKKVNALPIHICDRRTTIDKVEAWMTMAYEKWGIRVFWLDYLTLIEDHTGGKGDWVKIVGECCARIKERGKRLGITTVQLAQFSRLGQKTESEMTPAPPTLEALRDSGEIEQHADTVILVYKRPDLPMSAFDGDREWLMEWNFAKNRGGPTDRIPMVMIRNEQRYVTELQWEDIKKQKIQVDRNNEE